MVTLLIYEWEQMEIIKYKFNDQLEAEDFLKTTEKQRRISVEFANNFNWLGYYDRCIAGKK